MWELEEIDHKQIQIDYRWNRNSNIILHIKSIIPKHIILTENTWKLNTLASRYITIIHKERMTWKKRKHNIIIQSETIILLDAAGVWRTGHGALSQLPECWTPAGVGVWRVSCCNHTINPQKNFHNTKQAELGWCLAHSIFQYDIRTLRNSHY